MGPNRRQHLVLRRFGLLAASLLVLAACSGEEAVPRRVGVPPDANLWIARSGCEFLTRESLDGDVLSQVAAGCELESIASNPDGLWVSTNDGAVLRIDPAGGEVEARIDVGPRTGTLIAEPAGIWVVANETNEVVRIDPATNTIRARIPIGPNDAPVVRLAAGGGSVWALQDFVFQLVRIDPSSNTVTDRRSLCEEGECRVGDLAFGDDRVWVVDCCEGALAVIDPETATEVNTVALDAGLWELAGDDNGLWALEQNSGRIVNFTAGSTSGVPFADLETERALYPTTGAASVWFYDAIESEIVRIATRDASMTSRTPAARVRAFAVD